MAEELAVRFGAEVKRLRRAAKMTQEDLAAESGLTTTYVGMVERGETNVTLVAAQKVAVSLSVRLSSILGAISE